MKDILVISRGHGKTERLIREAYQQGRADAIAEFLEALVDKSEYFSVGNKIAESSFILEFIKIAEQLKEENNG